MRCSVIVAMWYLFISTLKVANQKGSIQKNEHLIAETENGFHTFLMLVLVYV